MFRHEKKAPRQYQHNQLNETLNNFVIGYNTKAIVLGEETL